MTPDYPDTVKNGVEDVLLKLLAYCRENNWAGYDPYDALNSKAFEVLPFLNSKLPRLILTQALKRSPINIRGLLGVPKTQNAKAMALFLSALLRLAKAHPPDRERLIELMINRLIDLRSPGVPYWCWGYSFPWQTRKEVVPLGTANLVCTTFVANALLDAYDHSKEERCLSMAVSAADYILNELYWTDGRSISSFCYPLPSLRVQVHNANFLAAALLCRVSKMTGDKKFLGPALKVVRCSVAKQKQDGSWDYGEAPSQRWIDNFHTGFNLGALNAIGQYLETAEFEEPLRRGFQFYRNHFFREDGAPKYMHNRTYPIDIHCVAQSIITLTEFKHLDPSSLPMARKVVQWATDNMWDGRGFFYYRVVRLMTIRTSYMRWSQAWMLLALATLLQDRETDAGDAIRNGSPAQVAASKGE
jgi:hypothetical protein